MKRQLFVFALIVGLLSVLESSAQDVVLDWNAAIRTAIQLDNTKSDPGWSSRAMAMANGAMYDTLMAIDRTHLPFLVDATAGEPVSRDAALSQAAYTILAHTYPGQDAGVFAPQLASSLSGIPAGAAKTAGIALGEAVANAYIAARADDHSDAFFLWPVNNDPGHWEPDPINPGQTGWGPKWGNVTPFAITSKEQFPVPPAPSMTDPAYTAAFNEVKSLGAKFSATRTAEQTEIGIFWGYDSQGTGPPPVLYNRNLDEIAVQAGNTIEENARMFAMASVAMADAGITAWESKYRDDFWRPVTAIRRADEDDNPDTEMDEFWEPLGAPHPTDPFTPPFPAYVSGHATFGAAMYGVLADFFGTDDIQFDLTSQELPGVIRHFDSFSQAAEENGRSRIYLGIHWSFDDTEGRALGGQIADWVSGQHFQPVPEPSSVTLAAIGFSTAAAILWRRRIRG